MDQDVAFARDIRPLFSDRDVSAMSSRIDLSSYDDVRANAERIYRRLADGTMPCYGPWPATTSSAFAPRTAVMDPAPQAAPNRSCSQGPLRAAHGDQPIPSTPDT
jgi:hypothetical protein